MEINMKIVKMTVNVSSVAPLLKACIFIGPLYVAALLFYASFFVSFVCCIV